MAPSVRMKYTRKLQENIKYDMAGLSRRQCQRSPFKSWTGTDSIINTKESEDA